MYLFSLTYANISPSTPIQYPKMNPINYVQPNKQCISSEIKSFHFSEFKKIARQIQSLNIKSHKKQAFSTGERNIKMNFSNILMAVIIVASLAFEKKSAASPSFPRITSQSYKQRLRRGFIIYMRQN